MSATPADGTSCGSANCSGFFGDRARRRPRDGRGRADRRADRRLAGRADDVHPPQDAGAQRRLRPHVPARARGGAPDLHRAGHHGGLQRRGAAARRRWRPPCASWPGARASTCTWPRSRATTSRHGWRELRAPGEKFVNLDTGEVLPADAPVVTANAYLRARPIADALAAGAQVVVTGRVTDAALVVGPALHAFGWSDDDLDAIAGAVVAGHVIECGAQCCGGNYAFFEEVPGRAAHRLPPGRAVRGRLVGHHQAPRDGRRGDGGDGDGAAALRDRRPALPQPRRGGPVRHHRALAGGSRPGAHRAGAGRGAAADAEGDGQPRCRLAQRHDAGHHRGPGRPRRRASRRRRCGPASRAAGTAFAETAEDLSGDLTGGGMAYLRLAVRGDDEQAVGRAFSGAVVETSLSSYPGTFFTSAPSRGPGRGPLLADDGLRRGRDAAHRVRRPTGRRRHRRLADPSPPAVRPHTVAAGTDARRAGSPAAARRTLVAVPLWVLVGARSGDKGGDANVGLWADDDAVAAWLPAQFSVDAVQGAAARGRAVRGQPLPAAEPAGRELRRARHPRLGRGLEPPSRHAGEGPRRTAALPPGRGAVGARRAGRPRRGSPRTDRSDRARASGRMAPWSRSPSGRALLGIALSSHGVERVHGLVVPG